MAQAGIIAEYDPFHKGHAYQVRYLKENGYDTVAVIMSGDFVQRGAPAWTDKYLRTRMALSQGVDLVFGLPVLYSLASAEGFATGGITSLDALPLDAFCFGCEAEDVSILQKAADLLEEDPDRINALIQHALREGLSYPAARERALMAVWTGQAEGGPHESSPAPDARYRAVASQLSAPNNILAIEYLKAVRRSHSHLVPIALHREESSYHQIHLSEEGLSSATAIRHAFGQAGSLDACRAALPDEAFVLLQSASGRYPMTRDDFSLMMYYALRTACERDSLSDFGEISSDLSGRIKHFISGYKGLEGFILQIKTKNITHARISRSLFQLLLGIPASLQEYVSRPVPYLRLLGMDQEKSHLLRRVTALPVITKVADHQQKLAEFYRDRPSDLDFAGRCMSLDLMAADLYRQAVCQKTGYLLPDEYHAGIMIR